MSSEKFCSSSDENSTSADSRESGVNVESKMSFSEEEEDLIGRLYNLLGHRWALIAGRIPGRSAAEIRKYCKRRFGTVSDGHSSTKFSVNVNPVLQIKT